MAVHKTPFLQLTTVAAAQGVGDAVTTMANFSSLPKSGTIMSMSLIDLGRATPGILLEVYLSQQTFTETTVNAAFDPSDTDILNCVGMILVPVASYSAFADSTISVQDNIGLPYYTPNGELYLQVIGRGAITPGSTTDLLLSLGIVY